MTTNDASVTTNHASEGDGQAGEHFTHLEHFEGDGQAGEHFTHFEHFEFDSSLNVHSINGCEFYMSALGKVPITSFLESSGAASYAES